MSDAPRWYPAVVEIGVALVAVLAVAAMVVTVGSAVADRVRKRFDGYGDGMDTKKHGQEIRPEDELTEEDRLDESAVDEDVEAELRERARDRMRNDSDRDR